MAEPRELRPIRQMAAALEGLLSQLADTPANVTPSTLRTAASAIVLFQSLCVRGVDPDLADKPPARFLVVDDDPISRRAVSMALKKVFQTPYAAENGKAALEFASREAFDVVFLDVEMPGMDGFEVCTKIHETAANEKTPVVFVTSHSDFESRAKSASTGGRDLIAKPFLSFEITVKALTLLLRSRLDQAKAEAALQSQKPVAARAANGSRVVPSLATPRQVSVSLPRQEPVLEAAPQPLASAPILPATENSSPVKKNSLESGQGNVSASGTPSTKEYAGAFAAHAPGHLREIQAQLAAVSQAREPGLRQEMLGELYVGLHTFTEEAERADLNVIWHLASAVEKVVRKLLEKTNAWTPSAVEAVATAVHLLEELCRGGAEPDLSNPPVRVLVVDDEPLARRAISSALQLNFAKPDNAESGEEALALTEKKPFDVIFMDVLMPGIDGFATCSKIRESGLNTTTPVVFVTGHSDAESREKSVRCGGNGFISKPVLPVEISLTALTFTLRSRMEHLKQPQPVAQLEPALCVH
jgi:CheY-like chemotaxis protein